MEASFPGNLGNLFTSMVGIFYYSSLPKNVFKALLAFTSLKNTVMYHFTTYGAL